MGGVGVELDGYGVSLFKILVGSLVERNVAAAVGAEVAELIIIFGTVGAVDVGYNVSGISKSVVGDIVVARYVAAKDGAVVLVVCIIIGFGTVGTDVVGYGVSCNITPDAADDGAGVSGFIIILGTVGEIVVG